MQVTVLQEFTSFVLRHTWVSLDGRELTPRAGAGSCYLAPELTGYLSLGQTS